MHVGREHLWRRRVGRITVRLPQMLALVRCGQLLVRERHLAGVDGLDSGRMEAVRFFLGRLLIVRRLMVGQRILPRLLAVHLGLHVLLVGLLTR